LVHAVVDNFGKGPQKRMLPHCSHVKNTDDVLTNCCRLTLTATTAIAPAFLVTLKARLMKVPRKVACHVQVDCSGVAQLALLVMFSLRQAVCQSRLVDVAGPSSAIAEGMHTMFHIKPRDLFPVVRSALMALP
jgi:hypothetical protein